MLIDDVDSFLQDRQHARQASEVSMVNEMLTRMEAFSGIFIASTNLMQGLDPAALRRFDLKVCFDFLRPEQAATLFASCCATMALPVGAQSAERLRALRLTPGDFAAVRRQHRFRPVGSALAFVDALVQEAAARQPASQGIGFVL